MKRETEKKSYYAVIPAKVRYCNKITPMARLLYGEITALSNEKGYCWASNKYLADQYETTERNIRRWVSDLKENRFIKVEIIGMKRKIWIMSQDIVPCDGDGIEKEVKKKEKKLGKDKIALKLVSWFDLNCKKTLKVAPMASEKGYFAVLRAINKGGLSEHQIVELFDEWFDSDQADEKKISIMAALSDYNINRFKVANNIK